MAKLTQEEFIAKAKAVHGDKYDYSLVDYKGNKTKIKIICLIHGVFEQTPNSHLMGRGCPHCFGKHKRTNETFIEAARKVHGDKYDYSLVDYKSNKTKVKIICPEHGVFEQTPNSHLHGSRCPYCAGNVKYTKETFIETAIRVHGDKYDYSLVDYKGNKTKVKIICPIHGVFEQIPFNHLRGTGCPYCASHAPYTTQTFIEAAKKVHGNKYSYDLVNYINATTKIKIICPEHGVFEQLPSEHLHGKGCRKCSGSEKYTNESFEEAARKIHGDKYDYSLVNYKDNKTKVKIVCSEHGVFEQKPISHLHGSGCPHCAGNAKHTKESFIDAAKKVHGDKYSYDLVNYINAFTKIKIVCPEHGVFEQTPNSHLLGSGCPQCVDLQNSKLEQLMAEFLTLNNIPYKRQEKYVWLKDKKLLKLDFYLPEYNIAIECHGGQHFEKHLLYKTKLETVLRRDEIKYKQCKEHGIDILYFAFKNYDENYKLGHIYTDLNELLQEILKYKKS